MTRFLIVRHPETLANTTGRYVGRGDAPYTALGAQQAELLVSEVVSWRPERVVSSPLRRTREVAEAAARQLDLAPVIDERLTELDFGRAEGMTLVEVTAAGLEFDFERADAPVAPGGESRQDIYLRSVAFALEQTQAGGTLAVITHGGVFRSLLVHLLGLSLEAIWCFDIRPAQIAEVHLVDGHGSLVAFRRPDAEHVDSAEDVSNG